MLFMIDQSVGLVKDVFSCQELLGRMVKEAEQVLQNTLARFTA